MKRKLGEICRIVSGSTPNTGIPEYWGGNLKWVTPAELDDKSRAINDTKRTITGLGATKTGLTPLPAGTVLLSSRAPIGKVAITDCEMYCNQGFKNLICSDSINNKYLYWFLKGKTRYLNSLGRGATFKEISKKIVADIEINLPDIEEQEKIVNRIGKIDSRLFMLRAEISRLDELIKARFVEMFSDKNFETKPFEDVCEELFAGGDVKRDRTVKDADSSHPYAVFTNGEKDDGLYGYTDIARVTKPSITISGRGTIGFCLVRAEPFYPAIRLIVATPKEGLVTPSYLKYFIDSKDYSGRGASIPQLTIPMIKDEPVPVPPLGLQEDFEKVVTQVDKSKFAVQKSLEKTQLLFNSLMQEYFG